MKSYVMEPNERYIAVVGEDFRSMLGHDEAKYLTPKVGIILHGPGEVRNEMSRMQVMSANADLAMYPLIQIMQVIQNTLNRYADLNARYAMPAAEMKQAIEIVNRARGMLNDARAGK